MRRTNTPTEARSTRCLSARWAPSLLMACAALAAVGCDDKPAPAPSASASAAAAVEKIVEAARPSGPPEISIEADGPRVGWTLVSVDQKDSEEKLAKALSEHAAFLKDATVTLKVDRKAKVPWVVQMVRQLDRAQVKLVKLTTETRGGFPKELAIIPLSRVEKPAPCSVTTMVLADRATATWKLSGGTAGRRSRGLGGPDLSMTADTLTRFAQGCKESTRLFFSADDTVEWGLAYDLAASAQVLEKYQLNQISLLYTTPVAGRAVALK